MAFATHPRECNWVKAINVSAPFFPPPIRPVTVFFSKILPSRLDNCRPDQFPALASFGQTKTLQHLPGFRIPLFFLEVINNMEPP